LTNCPATAVLVIVTRSSPFTNEETAAIRGRPTVTVGIINPQIRAKSANERSAIPVLMICVPPPSNGTASCQTSRNLPFKTLVAISYSPSTMQIREGPDNPLVWPLRYQKSALQA
jgi:hypothetical protein